MQRDRADMQSAGYKNPIYDPGYGLERQSSVFDRPSLSQVGTSLSSFYIDHVSKVTTWEDPRFKAPTQNQAAQALSPGRSSHHAQRGQGHQGETIPMRDMQRHSGHGSHTQHHHHQQQDTGFSRGDNQALVQKVKATLPTCPESVILQALFKNQNNYNMTVHELQSKGYTKDQPTLQLSNTPAAHLKELFPAAPAGVIQDVLAMCGSNEDEAKDQLIDLGFQMTRSSGSTSRTVSPSHSPRHQDSSISSRHSHSNQRRHSGNHSHQPAKPQISDSEKDRMVSKLAVEFPNLGKDIIKMALDATSFNEESAKRVLGGTATRGHSSRASSAITAGSSSRPSSSQQGPAVHVSSAEMDPVIFGSEGSESTPSASGTSRETTPSQSQQTATTSSSRYSGTSGQQQQKAKQVTKMSEQLLTTTNDMLNHLANSCCLRESQEAESSQSENSLDRKHHQHQPRAKRSKAPTPKTTSSTVTSQPRTSVSSYRTQANGPNPALRKGPDRSLLLRNYTSALGPNPNFRCGPDPSRVQGSQGALGPDPSLRCGPQSSLHMGPSLENLSERGGVLVSNV